MFKACALVLIIYDATQCRMNKSINSENFISLFFSYPFKTKTTASNIMCVSMYNKYPVKVILVLVSGNRKVNIV